MLPRRPWKYVTVFYTCDAFRAQIKNLRDQNGW